MKTKIVLAIFLILSYANLFAYYGGDYCPFNGISDDPNHTEEEEFAMLLESVYMPNFEAIANVIGVLITTPTETLKDPNCKISGYAKKLVEYYKKHKTEITNKEQEISELLDIIQKIVERDDSALNETNLGKS